MGLDRELANLMSANGSPASLLERKLKLELPSAPGDRLGVLVETQSELYVEPESTENGGVTLLLDVNPLVA